VTANNPSAPALSRIGLGRIIVLLLIAAGAVGIVYRFAFGLGASTNLSDGYPWGLWISWDVFVGVALAAGGFTISSAVYIFDLEQFKPLVRPAKLSAFVGYSLVVAGLLVDLGLPWRLWHALIMWNTDSVLFEVAWCVMLYTSVLAVEVLILVLEARKLHAAAGALRSISIFLVVAGLILSTLHQSSLGALFLLIPQKMSNLWASSALGPLFYASAVVAGLSAVIIESLVSAKAHGRAPEMKLLSSVGKGLATALLVYFAMKVVDLYARGVSIWQADVVHLLFYVELFGTAALPALLLGCIPDVRNSRAGLLSCAGLAAFGVVLNRFNVSIIGYAGYRDFVYFPSVVEILVTLGFIGFTILVLDLGARYLPLHDSHSHEAIGTA